ncbi:MAG TPA: aminopeptidase P family N-terminal domain-containing protein, partial [Conexibacter sp.]|nr:aminopeptidase P family N-terminal domain-containing protein [Conexibacter sp.]
MSIAPTARADRLAALLDERELDVLLVTSLVNVRYLTGYTGSNGLALVGSGLRRFVTDFRYETQAQEQVHGYDRVIG